MNPNDIRLNEIRNVLITINLDENEKKGIQISKVDPKVNNLFTLDNFGMKYLYPTRGMKELSGRSFR
jgi:hypothetical protein